MSKRVSAACVAFWLVVGVVAASVLAPGGEVTAALDPLQTRAATGHFEVVGPTIFDPDGVEFVPNGTNINGDHSYFNVSPLGKAAMLDTDWGFNTIRLTTCLPGGCDAGGYNHPDSGPANVAAIVNEYTARKMVVQIAYHQIPPGARATPTQINQAITFWTTQANAYKNNPYVWFNLFNEPDNHVHDFLAGQSPNAPANWRQTHQPVINAIRATGATNVLVLNETQTGQGAYEWGTWDMNPTSAGDSAVLTEAANLIDPSTRLAFSFHAYDVWGYPNDRSFPPTTNGTCPNRFTNAQREAKLRSYIERVRAAGFAINIGEVGYFPWEQPTTGRSFHGGYAQDFYPPCGSTQLLAADALYAIAPQYHLGILSWHGFDLTTSGPQNWNLNNPTNPTNLTRWGTQHHTHSRTEANRTPDTTPPTTTTTLPPTTTTTLPPTTTTTLPPTTTTTLPPNTTTTLPPAPTCMGRPITVNLNLGQQPTNSDDVILGTPNADVIRARAGNDTIYGGTGTDTIYGGTGNDTIYGEGGNDTIYGEADNDRLNGGSGTNTCDGGPGTDTATSNCTTKINIP